MQASNVFSGIDTIKILKRSVEPIRPISPKKRFNLWVIFLICLGLVNIFFWGLKGAGVLKAKLDVFNLFKDGKYLVLFQNNTEMRPSGGFIGSFAVVEFFDYKIKKIDFNTNIYKLDNPFTAAHTVIPPEPLAVANGGKWALRDSNFAVDFPEAAQKVEWFYGQETGDKVDGVVAINASVIQDLLKITGPIFLENYNAQISSENFFTELATKIEKEYFYDQKNWLENEPKSILKDLMPVLLDRAFTSSKIEVTKLLYKELAQKQVLFFSHDSKIQQSLENENWAGKVRETPSDYLAINNANINNDPSNKNVGAKSSLNIKETIDYKVNTVNGVMMGGLTLTRSHTGTYNWPDGMNTNWTRVLVPYGSELKVAELNGQDILNNVKIDSEAGKTTFGLWILTEPQTSNVLRLTYQLPVNVKPVNYSLLVQKQPGNLGDDLVASLNNRILFQGILKSDKLIK